MSDAKKQRQESYYFVPLAVNQDRATCFKNFNIIDTHDGIVLFNVNVSIIAYEVLMLDTWYGEKHSIKKFVDFDYVLVNNKTSAIAKINQSHSMLWQEQIPTYVAYTTQDLIAVTYAPKFLYTYDLTSELVLLSNFLCTFNPTQYIPNHIDGMPLLQQSIINAIEVLNDVICMHMKLFYLKHQGLGYVEFISKHNPYEVGFDILLVCAVINFLKKNETLENCLATLDILIEHCTCSVFIYTYKKLTSNRNELIYLLSEVFDKDPIMILQYITHHRHNMISETDITEVAIKKTFASEDTKTHDNVYTQIIFPFFFACVSPTVHEVNIYRNGQYSNLNRSDASTVLKPMLSMQHQKKKTSTITSLYETYIATIQATSERKYTPGKYRHFINTKIGVFCTITGTYMRKTPFLHFLETCQEKSYCLMPPTHKSESLNMKCILYQNEMCAGHPEPFHLSQSIDNIDLVWFNDIYLPNVTRQKYTLLEMNKIMLALKSRIKRQHKKFFYSHTTVAPEVITFVAHCISKVSWALTSKPPLTQLLEIIENSCNNEEIPTTSVPKPEDKLLACALLLLETKINSDQHLTTFTMSADLNETFRYIVDMCGWDVVMVKEFLAYFGNLYRPSNEHKKFLLLHGVSDSGKSTFVQYLKDWHGHSQCSQNGVLKSSDKSEAPGTTLATIAKSYTTVIHETKEISASVVKILTGQDDVDLRAHFAKHAQTIVPISFILCVSNQFPKMDVDIAILNRIVIFHLERQFKSTIQDHLKMFINNQIPIQNEVNFGKGLANLFFFASHLYPRTPDCMKNKSSVKALTLLMKNKSKICTGKRTQWL